MYSKVSENKIPAIMINPPITWIAVNFSLINIIEKNTAAGCSHDKMRVALIGVVNFWYLFPSVDATRVANTERYSNVSIFGVDIIIFAESSVNIPIVNDI